MKLAYLILAHGSYELLKELLKALDSPDNDIFVHLDLKAGDIDVSPFYGVIRYSKLRFIENRVDVKWGHISIVEATLNLFEEAVKGDYDYLNLLSGVDFPIKSNSYIQAFFQAHQGKEFVGFSKELTIQDVKKRSVWRPFIRRDFCGKHRVLGWVNGFVIRLQRYLHVYTLSPIHQIRQGAAWYSITRQLAAEVLGQRETILRRFKHVLLPDEMFLQTFLYEHHYMDRVFNVNDEFTSCCRYIDWHRGNPYVWQEDDLDDLLQSKYLWARKFSGDNMSLIRKISESISHA